MTADAPSRLILSCYEGLIPVPRAAAGVLFRLQKVAHSQPALSEGEDVGMAMACLGACDRDRFVERIGEFGP